MLDAIAVAEEAIPQTIAPAPGFFQKIRQILSRGLEEAGIIASNIPRMCSETTTANQAVVRRPKDRIDARGAPGVKRGRGRGGAYVRRPGPAQAPEVAEAQGSEDADALGSGDAHFHAYWEADLPGPSTLVDELLPPGAVLSTPGPSNAWDGFDDQADDDDMMLEHEPEPLVRRPRPRRPVRPPDRYTPG